MITLTLPERLLLLSFHPNGKPVTRVGWAGIAAAVAGGALIDLAIHGVLIPNGAGGLKVIPPSTDSPRNKIVEVIQRDTLPTKDRERPDRWMRDCTLITRAVANNLAAEGYGRTSWLGKYQPPEGFDKDTGWDTIRETLIDGHPADLDNEMILWLLTLDGLGANAVFSRDPLAQEDRDWWKKQYSAAEPRLESSENTEAIRTVLSGISRYTRWSPARA